MVSGKVKLHSVIPLSELAPENFSNDQMIDGVFADMVDSRLVLTSPKDANFSAKGLMETMPKEIKLDLTAQIKEIHKTANEMRPKILQQQKEYENFEANMEFINGKLGFTHTIPEIPKPQVRFPGNSIGAKGKNSYEVIVEALNDDPRIPIKPLVTVCADRETAESVHEEYVECLDWLVSHSLAAKISETKDKMSDLGIQDARDLFYSACHDFQYANAISLNVITEAIGSRGMFQDTKPSTVWWAWSTHQMKGFKSLSSLMMTDYKSYNEDEMKEISAEENQGKPSRQLLGFIKRYSEYEMEYAYITFQSACRTASNSLSIKPELCVLEKIYLALVAREICDSLLTNFYEENIAMGIKRDDMVWWEIIGTTTKLNGMVTSLTRSSHYVVLDSDQRVYLKIQNSEQQYVKKHTKSHNLRCKRIGPEIDGFGPVHEEAQCGKYVTDINVHEGSCNSCKTLISNEQKANQKEELIVDVPSKSPDGKFQSGIGTTHPVNPVIPPKNQAYKEIKYNESMNGEVIVISGGSETLSLESLTGSATMAASGSLNLDAEPQSLTVTPSLGNENALQNKIDELTRQAKWHHAEIERLDGLINDLYGLMEESSEVEKAREALRLAEERDTKEREERLARIMAEGVV